jgi:hypothetical protein
VKGWLVQLGREVFDPWAQPFSRAIREASAIEDYQERVSAYPRLAKDIGAVNGKAIRGCGILLAVVNGSDIDSGTAAKLVEFCQNDVRTDASKKSQRRRRSVP